MVTIELATPTLLLEATPGAQDGALSSDWYPGAFFVVLCLVFWGVWGYSRRKKRRGAMKQP